MFYIQGATGRTFEGSLEALRRVEKTARTHPERRITGQLDEEEGPVAPDTSNNAPNYAVSKGNAQQYSDMLEQQGSREAVLHAYQIMTQSIQLISSTWLVSQVVEHLRSFPFQVFPIVDERRQLIGTLSRQRFYEFLLDEGARYDLQSTRVSDCFVDEATNVYCSDPVTDIRRIAALLLEKKLDAIPIVEQSGRLVGIVSRTDILKSAAGDPPLSLWC